MTLNALSFDDRSQSNMALAEECLTVFKDKNYWDVLATRLYYAVFLKSKEIMFDWYKANYSAQTEEYFFNHKDLCNTIKKYIADKRKIIIPVDKAKLFINISTLWKYRIKADYEELPMEMDIESFKDRIRNAKDAIGVLNTLH